MLARAGGDGRVGEGEETDGARVVARAGGRVEGGEVGEVGGGVWGGGRGAVEGWAVEGWAGGWGGGEVRVCEG